jgi:hypothetical protein
MNLSFEHRDGWLQVRVSFKLPRGTLATAVFRWGRMGPAVGQIVAEWMNKALAQSVQATRATEYWNGRRDAHANAHGRYIFPDTLDD